MVLPTSGPSRATATSKVKLRVSAKVWSGLRRTFSSCGAANTTNSVPASATIRPIGAMSNSANPGLPVSTWYWPLTTRLVLVPISVMVPPRIEA